MKLFTTTEAARELGLSKARIQQFIDDGRLPATGRGGGKYRPAMLLIEEDELLKFAKVKRFIGHPKKRKQESDGNGQED